MKHEFLKEIVETYSPSGYEDELQKKLYNHYKEWCNTFKTDNRGAMTAIYNEKGDFKVMLIAHADEISLVVNGYNSDGSLRVDKNGGIRNDQHPKNESRYCSSKQRLFPGILIRKQKKGISRSICQEI